MGASEGYRGGLEARLTSGRARAGLATSSTSTASAAHGAVLLEAGLTTGRARGGPVASALAAATSSSSTTSAARREALKFWWDRSSALAAREVHLHHALHPELKTILADKRILVFSEMLEHLGFPRRSDLVHFMVSGFPVVGAYPRTDIFPAAERRAIYTPEDLWRLSRRLRRDLAAAAGGASEPALDEEV